MKVLTLSQPWATAIAIGAKKIETRNWHPREHPRVIAIASSNKNMTAGQRDLAMRTLGDHLDFPRRSIVAIAQVRVCVKTDGFVERNDTPRLEQDLGDFSPGRWAWLLGEVITLADPIELYPVTPPNGGKPRLPGALNLWTLPEPFYARVEKAVGGAGELRRLYR
jgi:hypothetical protein